MIDKKNLNILKKIVKSKDTLFVSYTRDKQLPNGTICEFNSTELKWLNRQHYINITPSVSSYDDTTGKHLAGEVEATPEGKALVEGSIKEKKNTVFFKWIPLIVSIIAIIFSFISLYISNSKVP